MNPAVVVPLFLSLGLDTFAVAVGLGISGLERRAQLRYGVAFALAEGIMPLVGYLLGRVIATALGDVASYVAIALLFGVGVYTVWEATHDEERTYEAAGPVRLGLLALSVSMDELAVGFTIGLLHVPIAVAVIYIALQAFVVTMVGTAVGRWIGERVAAGAEVIAGVVLALLAVVLLGEKVIGG